MQPNRILVIDDEAVICDACRLALSDYGFAVDTCLSGGQGLAMLIDGQYDLALLDMKLPDLDGLSILQTIKKERPEVYVIIITGYSSVENAVEAMKLGAFDYLAKPFIEDELVLAVKRAIESKRLKEENLALRSQLSERYDFGNIIGENPGIIKIFDQIQKVAPTDSTVLLCGESGTGKELFARAIHAHSKRASRQFVAMDCSTFSSSLLESELFGHEKGAFTGAVASKKGRFELADSGTLFLDEIGELSPNLQVKLLRVLQEKTFERVGGVRPIGVNIRVIAATNKNLTEEMASGRFREDLYYRLNVVHIALPPLKDRREDIRLLVNHFLEKYASERQYAVPIKGFDPEVQRLFDDYSWPGNVRELENLIERVMILCPGDIIRVSDLPQGFRDNVYNTLHLDGIPANAGLYETLAMVEKAMIERALKMANNVQAHAAAMLGIGKSGLNQKIKKFHLDGSSKD